jgi:hypothetical protein
MKFKLLIYGALALLINIVLWGFFVLRNINIEQPVDETRTVYVKQTGVGYQLIRNGEPFFIQGAGGDSHFKELAEIGGNTIRVFDTSNLEDKLDEAHKNNLAVIVDIYLPAYSKAYNLYDDEEVNENLKQKIRDLVYQHKDHPALLIWNLGNEINYPFVFRKNDFIKTFNELVSIIQEVDPNHPVSTSIIGVGRKTMSSIYIHSPELDLLSFNTFGNTRFINSYLAQISFLFGSRPYFFSEYGPNGPWESITTSWGAPIEETSSIKSERIRTRFNTINDIKGGGNLGSLMFYWGTKLERTHTWFSLFKGGYKSEIINVIETLWQQSDIFPELDGIDYILVNSKGSHDNIVFSPGELSHSDISPKLIGLDYMLVNELGSHDNIVFSPGELSHAEIIFHENYNDSVRIDWEIYPEAWYSDTSETVLTNYEPIDTFVICEKNKTTFLAPTKEGPYRIFAYIYDQDGFFATTNTPFYVLKN